LHIYRCEWEWERLTGSCLLAVWVVWQFHRYAHHDHLHCQIIKWLERKFSNKMLVIDYNKWTFYLLGAVTKLFCLILNSGQVVIDHQILMTHMLSRKYKVNMAKHTDFTRENLLQTKCISFFTTVQGKDSWCATYMLAGSLKIFSTCAYKSAPDTLVPLATGTCKNEINDDKGRALLFDPFKHCNYHLPGSISKRSEYLLRWDYWRMGFPLQKWCVQDCQPKTINQNHNQAL
jgi:hypothetical protein